MIFLGTILAVVVYLTVTDKDRTEAAARAATPTPVADAREGASWTSRSAPGILVVTDHAEPTPDPA